MEFENELLKRTEDIIIHIKLQQRNGKKSFTIIEGIPVIIDLKKILKLMTQEFSCGGSIQTDENTHEKVIVLQGDQRNKANKFLFDEKIVSNKKWIKMHGY